MVEISLFFRVNANGECIEQGEFVAEATAQGADGNAAGSYEQVENNGSCAGHDTVAGGQAQGKIRDQNRMKQISKIRMPSEH